MLNVRDYGRIAVRFCHRKGNFRFGPQHPFLGRQGPPENQTMKSPQFSRILNSVVRTGKKEPPTVVTVL